MDGPWQSGPIGKGDTVNKVTWVAVAMLSVAGVNGPTCGADERLPPPDKLPAATAKSSGKAQQLRELTAPDPAPGATVGGPAPGNCGGCAGGKGTCWQNCKGWFFFHPCKLTCCGQYDRFAPYTPHLYTYFLHPPCVEGCGQTCQKGDCGVLYQRCGFCASGLRNFGQTTGLGFGLVDGPGRMK
jgi:hypothetical protein